ncbi:MAG: hypothetical protein ACREC9_12450 [Methylocella sp.]
MSTEEVEIARVPTIVEEPMEFTVIATNPSEMERGQKSMILWAARKIQAEKQDCADAEAQCAIAAKNKWTMGPWRRRVKIAGQRMDFYRKIKLALEAGYYIIPPFPMDVFAIRTNRRFPRFQQAENKNDIRQLAQALAPGAGTYKSPHPPFHAEDSYARKQDGSFDYDTLLKTDYYADTYRDLAPVDFPFKMVKPIVMEETAKAMALKIFDQFGMLPVIPNPSQPVRADPIICGQILAPHKGRKPLTFFIAWWLDTRSI